MSGSIKALVEPAVEATKIARRGRNFEHVQNSTTGACDSIFSSHDGKFCVRDEHDDVRDAHDDARTRTTRARRPKTPSAARVVRRSTTIVNAIYIFKLLHANALYRTTADAIAAEGNRTTGNIARQL